jgi:hypothetical protein
VLFALRHPAILLGLVVGFVVGCTIRAILQQRLASGRSLSGRPARGRRLRTAGTARPAHGPWTSYLDPYGAVAAVIAGVGWGARVPLRTTRGSRALAPLLVALSVHAVLAVAGFAAYRALSGPAVLGKGVAASDVLHGSLALGSAGAQVAAGFAVENLACGLLALTPIPPLELGVLLWSTLPRTPGARRFAYHLLEEAWGVLVVLVGLLLPLAGQQPALLALIDILADPLMRLA